MSGQLQNYDFNYDDAYANVIKDFAKPVEVEEPKDLQPIKNEIVNIDTVERKPLTFKDLVEVFSFQE